MNISQNIAYMKYFGFELTFHKTIAKIFKCKTSNSKISELIRNANNNKIESYLIHTCNDSYKKLLCGNYEIINREDVSRMIVDKDTTLVNNVIWTLWWDGEENAPIIVKKCINSLRNHSNGHKVIVLNKHNINEYIKIPECIKKQHEERTNDNSDLKDITLDDTKLSDVIRAYLLYSYGGVWADATIMLSKDINNIFFNSEFQTLGQDDPLYIGGGAWSTFFMSSSQGNGFIKFNYDMHIEYWSKKKYYVNYLMTDHIYDIAYNKVKSFHEMVDKVTCGNRKCLTINRMHDEPVDIQEINKFLTHQYIHKLSWKWQGIAANTISGLHTPDGRLTWLGYMINNY